MCVIALRHVHSIHSKWLPNKCWIHTCNACIITTWRLGLPAPLVAHNQCRKFLLYELQLYKPCYLRYVHKYTTFHAVVFEVGMFKGTSVSHLPLQFFWDNLVYPQQCHLDRQQQNCTFISIFEQLQFVSSVIILKMRTWKLCGRVKKGVHVYI